MSEFIENLTESQKACLRLVAKGMTSKEIAQVTGLAPQTVDTYLKMAMSRLSAPTRRDAARKLLQQELSQQLGSPPLTIAATSARGDQGDATRNRGWFQTLAPPRLGGTVNDLDSTQRTYAVLKVAAISAAVVIALTLLIAGMLETFR